MRAGGFNTLDTIEHLTLLLFFRLLADPHPERAPDVGSLSERLGSADPLAACLASKEPARHFREVVYPQLKEVVAETAPQHPARSITDGFEPRIDDQRLFRKLLELVAEVPLHAPDLNGLIYEHLIGTLSEAGHLGQYFTPRHVVDLMVSLVAPEPGESIYDPACGTGGFLIGAMPHAPSQRPGPSMPSLHGREINRTVRRLCVMNLLLRGLDTSGIAGGDALGESVETGIYDVVLTNPPFGGVVSSDAAKYPVPTKASEGLFLQHVLAALRPGGRAAVVCPEGLLANIGSGKEIRTHLMDHARVDAVISLPAGVFNPYTAVRTGIVVFTKGKPTRRVWFFDVKKDGFELNTGRLPAEDSDLPAVLEVFHSRAESKRSVIAEREALSRHDERLVASRYLFDAHRGEVDAWVELGQVCRLKKQSVRPSESPDTPFAYVAMEHIEPRSGQLLPIQPKLGAEIRSTKARFGKGDILYGKLRPYLAKAVLADLDGICSTELLVLEPDADMVRGDYLAEVLRSSRFTESAVALAVGANHPRVHPGDLIKIRIPVPGLEIQDEVMRRVGAARSRIDEAKGEIADANEAIERAVAAAWG